MEEESVDRHKLSVTSLSRRVLLLLSLAATQWWKLKASESVDGCTHGALWKVSAVPGSWHCDTGAGRHGEGHRWACRAETAVRNSLLLGLD